MNRKVLSYSVIVLLVSLFVFTGTSLAQSAFEGKITFTGDGADGETVEYLTKDGAIRMNAPDGEQGTMIMKDGKMIILMPQMNMYMEQPLDVDETITEQDVAEADIQKTGETKDILGYTCEKWVATDNGEEAEMWVTDEIGNFFFFDAVKKDAAFTDIFGDSFFPMEIIDGGSVVFKVTAVEEMSLEESLFEVPAGYKKMDMPQMPK